MLEKKCAAYDLFSAKRILDNLGIKSWLTLGTCLGAFRDHDFCEADWDDSDMGVDISDFARWPEISKAFMKAGFIAKLYLPADGLCSEGSFTKRYGNFKTKVDLFFYTPNPNNPNEVMWRFYANDEATVYKTKAIAAKFHYNFKEIEFYGEKYLIPLEIEDYLTANYGDWKTPIHRSDWNWYNDNKSKDV